MSNLSASSLSPPSTDWSLQTWPAPRPLSGKLQKSAEQFETMLLGNLLEKMKESFAGSEPGQDAGQSTFESLGTQVVAQALAAHGGFGIAKILLSHLANAVSPHQAGAVMAGPAAQASPAQE